MFMLRCSVSGSRMYQFGTSSMPSGLRVHDEHDHVVEDAHRLLVGAADQLVDRLDQLLRAEHFGGVQAAVDPHDRLAFPRQRLRLVVGQAVGERELAARSPCTREQLREILGRRDDRHELRTAFLRLADRRRPSCGRTRASSFFQYVANCV